MVLTACTDNSDAKCPHPPSLMIFEMISHFKSSIFATLKIHNLGIIFIFISKQENDLAFSQEFYFHETSHMHYALHMQSFVKIKPSRIFLILQ